jgi:hypothetical protein
MLYANLIKPMLQLCVEEQTTKLTLYRYYSLQGPTFIS